METYTYETADTSKTRAYRIAKEGIDPEDIAAAVVVKYLCPGCKYTEEEAETLEELVTHLENDGWENTQLEDTVGVFCPACIRGESQA